MMRPRTLDPLVGDTIYGVVNFFHVQPLNQWAHVIVTTTHMMCTS